MLDQMRNALVATAVKYQGSGQPIPALEFVMHPNKLADAILEARIHDPEMVMMTDGSWAFRSIPIVKDVDQSTWTLAPVRQPNFCESCAGAAASCDCVNPRHIYATPSNPKEDV